MQESDGWPETYIAGIREQLVPVADWQAAFRREMEELGLRLTDDGDIYYACYPGHEYSLGRYRLLEAEAAQREYAGAAWLSASTPCPLYGGTVGYVEWFPYLITDESRDIATYALYAGRGVLARVQDGQFQQSILLRRFALADCIGKYGFGNGEWLLSQDDDEYTSYVMGEMQNCLLSAGWEHPIQWCDGCGHCKFRWLFVTGSFREEGYVEDPDTGIRLHVDKPSGELRPPDEVLESLFVSIWVYNDEVLEHSLFAGNHPPL